MNDRKALEGKTYISGETIKQIFWQTSINDQRPTLKISTSDNVIEVLVDIRADVTTISVESWHSNWPLQEAFRDGSLSEVKQCMRRV